MAHVKAKYFGELDKFNDIYPSLTAFEPSNKRLVLTQASRDFALREVRLHALFNQERDKCVVPR